jgi:hypothetical protein
MRIGLDQGPRDGWLEGNAPTSPIALSSHDLFDRCADARAESDEDSRGKEPVWQSLPDSHLPILR